MNGSRIADEFLAEESGVDYDEVFSLHNDLSKAVFGDLYECCRCDEIRDLSEFKDTEYDGDVIGTCPNCGTRTIILPVS